MFDAPVPGGGGAKAFEVVVTDLTTGQSGFMQASAANGFQNTSIKDCSGTPHNFEPEYNTAAKANIIPWAALQTNISTQYETGHWEPCTSLDRARHVHLLERHHRHVLQQVQGSLRERRATTARPEVSDAFCYPKGDTHGALHTAPDTVTGCTDSLFQNGDLDFDGPPYWADWPQGPSRRPRSPGASSRISRPARETSTRSSSSRPTSRSASPRAAARRTRAAACRRLDRGTSTRTGRA